MPRTQRCFEPASLQRFVIKTRPRICDVAVGLSPLAVWFHRAERCDPAEAGNGEKNGEAVLARHLHARRWQYPLRLLALGGALFLEELRHADGDEDSGPIGNRISEK